VHGSDRINFHFYFAGISILDDSTLPLLQIVACFSKKSRFHGNSCHSCYAVEISRTCQLHVNYESPNFSDFVLRIPILSIHVLGYPNLSLHFSSFCTVLYVSITFRAFLIRFTLLRVYQNAEYIYWLRYRLCASFSETFTKTQARQSQ